MAPSGCGRTPVGTCWPAEDLTRAVVAFPSVAIAGSRAITSIPAPPWTGDSPACSTMSGYLDDGSSSKTLGLGRMQRLGVRMCVTISAVRQLEEAALQLREERRREAFELFRRQANLVANFWLHNGLIRDVLDYVATPKDAIVAHQGVTDRLHFMQRVTVLWPIHLTGVGLFGGSAEPPSWCAFQGGRSGSAIGPWAPRGLGRACEARVWAAAQGAFTMPGYSG